MEAACKKIVGSHDFRNFCKTSIGKSNYVRSVHSACVKPAQFDDTLLMLEIKASGFLWHMIRCIVAVLYTVGRGFEEPNVFFKSQNHIVLLKYSTVQSLHKV